VPLQAFAAAAPTPGQVQDTLPPPPAPELEKNAPEPERQNGAPASQVPAGGPTVTVKAFALAGNTVFSDQQLQTVVAAYAGHDLTLGQIYEAADRLTRFYHEHGYTLASVTVPAQKLDQGTVHLEVIEGRIGRIVVEGNRRYNGGTILGLLHQLAPGEIYRSADMERAILLVNDLPGLQARVVIKPGDTYGTSDIILRVRESLGRFSATGDNFGREEIGKDRLLLSGELDSLTGHGDRLSGDIIHSQQGLLDYGRIAWGLPVGNNGGRLRASYNRADYEVGGPIFGPLAISGKNADARLEYSYPLVRSRRTNWVLTAAADRNSSDVATAATPQGTSNHLNFLEISLFNNHVFSGGSYYTLGLQYAGNGKSSDGTQQDAMQGKLRLDAGYTLPFAGEWELTGNAAAVYSADPLPDTQKFSVGGPTSVRGYLPADARGDEGGYLSLALRRNIYAGDWRFSPGLVADGGRVIDHPTPTNTGLVRDSNLYSAGVDLTINYSNWLGADLIWAKPIGGGIDPSDGKDSGRVWASLSFRF
jgi:hemolysin activation/secretion protein